MRPPVPRFANRKKVFIFASKYSDGGRYGRKIKPDKVSNEPPPVTEMPGKIFTMDYTITTHRHFRDFTIIPNAILRDEVLTFFDKGLLCYLLSLPEDWEIKVAYIAEHFGETERYILRTMKNLIDAGYCRRVPRYEKGRLAGQHYQVTDIANDFSAPQKNSAPAKNEGAANSSPQGNPAPLKNEGAYKENTLFNEETIIVKEEKKDTHTREKLCLFADSKFFNFDAFKAALEKDGKYAGADFEYYYECIKNWSASKGAKKYDWIATARNWILSDFRDGKLKKSREAVAASEADEWADALKKYAEEKKRFGV